MRTACVRGLVGLATLVGIGLAPTAAGAQASDICANQESDPAPSNFEAFDPEAHLGSVQLECRGDTLVVIDPAYESDDWVSETSTPNDERWDWGDFALGLFFGSPFGVIFLSLLLAVIYCIIDTQTMKRKKAKSEEQKRIAARERSLKRLRDVRVRYMDYIQLRERAHRLISLSPGTPVQTLRFSLSVLDGREEATAAAMVAIGDPDQLTTGEIADGCLKLETLLNGIRGDLRVVKTSCDAIGRNHLLEAVPS